MNINWLDYLGEQVTRGLSLQYCRQRRGYRLFWTGKTPNDEKGMYEVRQGASGLYGDKKQFTSFSEAYDWLLNGTPIKIMK